MSRYIDVGKQLVRLYRLGLSCGDVVKQFLLTAPAADVVEVVRCKECKYADLFYPYCTIWEAAIDGDGYCYKGEKE